MLGLPFWRIKLWENTCKVRRNTNEKTDDTFGSSRTEKEAKKSAKKRKRVLTKLLGRDNINKLAHAGDRGGRALNLENDTEQKKRKQRDSNSE